VGRSRLRRPGARRHAVVPAIVNAALRDAFARTPVTAPPFSMVTYGDERARVMHEPTDFAAVIEDEDRQRLR
jgi:hypothetical protein